jgi:hypothetical protein
VCSLIWRQQSAQMVCGGLREDVKHLFFECLVVLKSWENIHSCSQWTKQSLHLWYKKINCKWVYCVCYSLVVMYWCEIEAAASMWIACVVMLLQIGILWYTVIDLAKRNYIFTLEIDIKYNKIVSLFVCFWNACKL